MVIASISGGVYRARRLLSDLATKHRVATATLTLGATSASESIQVAVFHRPRSRGVRAFWDAAAFYKLLRMSAYAGHSSKWLCARSDEWKKLFVSLLGEDQLVYSTQLHDKMNRRLNMDWASRCLPFSGFSTLWLLTLLCKWSFASKFSGGLDDASGKQQMSRGRCSSARTLAAPPTTQACTMCCSTAASATLCRRDLLTNS